MFYALDSRQESILWDVKPSFVVVYDPDITFVRQLEVLSCSTGLQVHMPSILAIAFVRAATAALQACDTLTGSSTPDLACSCIITSMVELLH